jgi:hypothetical protein
MHTGLHGSRVTSKKLQNSKPKKANGKKRTARRSALFKSASWYANAALSIGASAKGETSAY